MLKFGLALAVLVFILDQIAKYVILGPLGFSPPGCLENNTGCGVIHVLPFFDLRMLWNPGVSFGMLRADSGFGRWALVALSFTISGVFLWWLRTAECGSTPGVALGLVVGGALGNVIDRIRFGAVADFLDFQGLFFPWVFNVADASITVGAILLGLDWLMHSEEKPADKPGGAKPAVAGARGADSPQNGHDPG